MRTLPLLLLAALAASAIPVQATVNGRLGQYLANPFLAALCSFLGGTALLTLVILITTPGWPSLPEGRSLLSVNPLLLTGGLLGAVFVTTVLTLVPRVGPANVITATIVGQLLASVIIEHYGWLALPQHPVGWAKVAGCGLLIVGMMLIQWNPPDVIEPAQPTIESTTAAARLLDGDS